MTSIEAIASKNISKKDTIRHLVLKKMCETEHEQFIIRVFTISVKEDEAIVKTEKARTI